MIEAIELVWLTACRLFECWGIGFLMLPFFLGAVAVWDFLDWRANREP